jgi:hypothetical protein
MRIRGRLFESWCVVERGVQASFYRPRERERGHEYAWIAWNDGAVKLPLRWQFYALVNDT